MEIPHKIWIEAVRARISRRAFEKRPLEAEVLGPLEAFTKAFTFFDGARMVFKAEGADQALKGIFGSYGGVANARTFLGLVIDPGNPHAQERAGYLGEAFILEATRMGLGSCWIGGSYDPEKAAELLGIGSQEKVAAVIPVGHAQEAHLLHEKLIKAVAGSHRRKEIKDLVTSSLPEEKWPRWAAAAVEAARLAPSAVNRQPWRFEVTERGITVSFAGQEFERPTSKRLDCGIAMLHLEVGSRAAGMSGSWQFLESPKVARFKAVV